MSTFLLRLPEVVRRTGLSKNSIYRLQQRGRFPRPVKLSERASGWPENEIAAINAARISGQSDDEILGLVKRLVAARAHAFDQFESAAA